MKRREVLIAGLTGSVLSAGCAGRDRTEGDGRESDPDSVDTATDSSTGTGPSPQATTDGSTRTEATDGPTGRDTDERAASATDDSTERLERESTSAGEADGSTTTEPSDRASDDTETAGEATTTGDEPPDRTDERSTEPTTAEPTTTESATSDPAERSTMSAGSVAFEVETRVSGSCGTYCRRVATSVTNGGTADAHDVVVVTTLSVDGERLDRSSERIGRLPAGETERLTQRLSVGADEAATLRTNGGGVLQTTVTADEATETTSERIEG